MKSSVLHLEGYHLKEFSLELNEGFAKKTLFGAWSGYHYQPDKAFKVEPVDFKVGSEIGTKIDDPYSLRYMLKIESTGRKDRVPYSFRISLIGYFHIDKRHADKDTSVLLYANAPSLLYSAAREMLASVSARGPYPAVILPAVTFLDDAEKLVQEEAKVLPVGRKQVSQKGVIKARARKAK